MAQADIDNSTPAPGAETTPSNDVFRHVGSIEPALTHIRNFLDALALISETMEEPAASAVNVIVHATLDHVTEADEAYVALFKLSHPDRERFEREGWPGGAEGNECA